VARGLRSPALCGSEVDSSRSRNDAGAPWKLEASRGARDSEECVGHPLGSASMRLHVSRLDGIRFFKYSEAFYKRERLHASSVTSFPTSSSGN